MRVLVASVDFGGLSGFVAAVLLLVSSPPGPSALTFVCCQGARGSASRPGLAKPKLVFCLLVGKLCPRPSAASTTDSVEVVGNCETCVAIVPQAHRHLTTVRPGFCF